MEIAVAWMNRIMQYCSLIFISLLCFQNLSAEGIRELRPDSTISSADLYFDSYPTGDYPLFGIAGCLPNYRLCIHIKQAGECILFGLRYPLSDILFNLRKPDGTIAMSGICPSQSGQNGYIRYHKQAVKGPFPSAGGYDPLIYTVTNPADTGDYYFEIANQPIYLSARVSLWDFQVVSGLNTPALPSDTINGRVWSRSWQINAELALYRVFNGRFYILADDGIVTTLSFSNARVGVFNVFCNPYGCLNTGNYISDRQSKNSNTYAVFPDIADYKVFLNNPDTSVYPDGVLGEIIAPPPFMVPDPSFPACSGHELIFVSVNKAGRVQVHITLPYGSPSTDILLVVPVSPGVNQITWNGLDGLNNPIPDGTLVTVNIDYLNGLTNLPVWDQEQNTYGYRIAPVRPVVLSNPIPLTYWDDSQISSGWGCPTGTNLTGCLPGPNGCHTWTGDDCHNKMINTWWYGNTSTAVFTAIYFQTPPDPSGQGASRCGPGSITLSATVLPGETADWYDTITGGIPLLMGSTTFVTPVISSTTTYYAAARNDSSGCMSVNRIPVVATILPVPFPTISGPDLLCEGTSGSVYYTESGKTGYQWAVSPGGQIITGAGTESILVNWISAGNQWVSVNYTEPGGCAATVPTLLRVRIVPPPGPAGGISGSPSVCSGDTALLYTVDPIPFATGYTWIIPPGAVILSGAGTSSILVSFPPGATSGVFLVFGTNPCGDGLPSPPYPVTVNSPPQADAGPDGQTCRDVPFRITQASAINYQGLKWITNGLGLLEGDTTLNPVYTPFPGETGIVNFTLIAYGNSPCPADTAAMRLHISPTSFVDGGPALLGCGNMPVTMENTMASGYQSLQWNTSGDGTFSDSSLLHPVYYPGDADTLSGEVFLVITAIAQSPCPPVSDTVILTLSEQSYVTAGENASICENMGFTPLQAAAGNYSALAWISSGDGTFDNPAILHPLYTPGDQDIQSGSAILYLEAAASQPCPGATDSLLLTIYPSPSAIAGEDGATCSYRPFTLSGASASQYSDLTWLHDGQGTISDANTLAPTYTPSHAETGIVIFTFVVTGKGACDTVVATDQVSLHIYLPPSADAGPEQEISGGASAILTASVTGGSGTFGYHWEPAGLLDNPSSASPSTLPLMDTATFFLTATDLETGCTGTDSVRILVQAIPDTNECLHIYNTVTPNGDGNNDTWIIDCIQNYPQNHVVIMNRWGDAVREYDHYDNTTVAWNGTDRHGGTVPDGTYYYVLTLRSGVTRAGWIFVRGGLK